MAAWVIPVALGAASAIGSIASAIDTNKANKQIARETNQANLDLYREQFQDTKELNDINNAWNAPQNQVSMLRQAGLNPALAYGDAAQASMPTLPSAPEMKAYKYESPLAGPFDSMIGTVGDVVQSYKDSEEAKGMFIDNQTRSEQNQYNLNLLRESIKARQQEYQKSSAEWAHFQKLIDALDLQLQRQRDTYDSDVENASLQNDLIKSQIKNAEREQNRQDALALLKRAETEYNIKFTEKQIENLALSMEIMKSDLFMRFGEYQQDIELKRLDRALKSVGYSDKVMNHLFNMAIQDSELLHTHLKDKSTINRLAERCFGIGLRDLGLFFRSLATSAAVSSSVK